MKENGEVTIRIGQWVEDLALAKNQTFVEWFTDALGLAVAVDQGSVYRLIGEDFEQVRMSDFNPHLEESLLKVHHEFVIWPQTFEDFAKKPRSYKELGQRIISLGIMAENLNLYFFDGEEYNRIEFAPEPK